MFYPFRLFIKDRWILLSLIVTVFLVGFMGWHTFSKIKPTDQLLSLHYNIIFGVDLIGEWWKMRFLPAGGLVMAVANFGVSHLLYAKRRGLSRFLAVITALLEILLLVAVILLVGLNT